MAASIASLRPGGSAKCVRIRKVGMRKVKKLRNGRLRFVKGKCRS